jgi:hypothetical protein
MILKFKQFEGKYDKITGISVDEIWKIIKITRVLNELKFDEESGISKDELGFVEKQIDYSFETPLAYDLILRIKREPVAFKEGFYIDGASSAEDEEIMIELIIDPSREPQCYSRLNSYLQETVRHELEHLTHKGYNRIEDRPDPEKTLKMRETINAASRKGSFVNTYKYYLLEDELPCLIHGMYRKAKTDKKPITTIFNEFLTLMEEEGFLTPKKRKLVYDTWVKYAKEKLPQAKYEKYEIDPYNEEIWDPEQHYLVTLFVGVKMNAFIKKIENDGFEVLNKWPFGVVHVRANGRLAELKAYPEVEQAKLEDIVSF